MTSSCRLAMMRALRWCGASRGRVAWEQVLKAKCGVCNKIVDRPIQDWSWVRFRGDFTEKLVCPKCRLKVEKVPGNSVSSVSL